MRPLEALLAHPQVAQVGDRVVAGGARANHHHPAGFAHEYRSGNRVLARMVEYDAGVFALAEDVPNRLAEIAALRRPFAVGRLVLPVRHHAPMRKSLAIDDAGGAQLHAEILLAIVADHAD